MLTPKIEPSTYHIQLQPLIHEVNNFMISTNLTDRSVYIYQKYKCEAISISLSVHICCSWALAIFTSEYEQQQVNYFQFQTVSFHV